MKVPLTPVRESYKAASVGSSTSKKILGLINSSPTMTSHIESSTSPNKPALNSNNNPIADSSISNIDCISSGETCTVTSQDTPTSPHPEFTIVSAISCVSEKTIQNVITETVQTSEDLIGDESLKEKSTFKLTVDTICSSVVTEVSPSYFTDEKLLEDVESTHSGYMDEDHLFDLDSVYDGESVRDLDIENKKGESGVSVAKGPPYMHSDSFEDLNFEPDQELIGDNKKIQNTRDDDWSYIHQRNLQDSSTDQLENSCSNQKDTNASSAQTLSPKYPDESKASEKETTFDIQSVNGENFDAMSIAVMDDDFTEEGVNEGAAIQTGEIMTVKISEGRRSTQISEEVKGKESTRISPVRPPVKKVSPPNVDSSMMMKWNRSFSEEKKNNIQRSRKSLNNESVSGIASRLGLNNNSGFRTKDDEFDSPIARSTPMLRGRGNLNRGKWNSNRGKQYNLRQNSKRNFTNCIRSIPQTSKKSFSIPQLQGNTRFTLPQLTQNKSFPPRLSLNTTFNFPPMHVNQSKPTWTAPLLPPPQPQPTIRPLQPTIRPLQPTIRPLQPTIRPLHVDILLPPSEDISVQSLVRGTSIKRFNEASIETKKSPSASGRIEGTGSDHNIYNQNSITSSSHHPSSLHSGSNSSSTVHLHANNCGSDGYVECNSTISSSSSMCQSNEVSHTEKVNFHHVNHTQSINNVHSSRNDLMYNNETNQTSHNVRVTNHHKDGVDYPNSSLTNNELVWNNKSIEVNTSHVSPRNHHSANVQVSPIQNLLPESSGRPSHFLPNTSAKDDVNHNKEGHVYEYTVGVPPPNVHKIDPKEILREPFHSAKDTKRAWWHIWLLKYIHGQIHPLNNEDFKAYQGAIEDFLLNLKDHVSKENADIAFDVIELKRSLFGLRAQDLLYYTDIQARSERFDRAFSALKELVTKHGTRSIKKEDLEKLFFDCIEMEGNILQHWDDFREHVIYSDMVMDKVFSTIPLELLQRKITKIDLAHTYQQLISGRMSLSPNSKSIFLELFSEGATLVQLVELLKEWPNLNCVPLVTIEKILTSIQCFSDVLSPLNVLRRLPPDVAAKAVDSWNNLLLNCYNQGDQYIQAGEQIFSLMKKYNVPPTLQASVLMLESLCTCDQLDLFEQRFDYIQGQSIFPEDFKIPDSLALKLSNMLDGFTRDDMNVLLKLITFSLRSSIQPNEEKVSEVINMLIEKRRCPELHTFVTECFNRRFLLSQIHLRHIIFTLEKWTANPEASVEIYRLMRSVYPRPEHTCSCQFSRERKSSTSMEPNNHETLVKVVNVNESLRNVEDVSQYGRFMPKDHKMSEDITQHTTQHHTDRNFLKLAAELNENSLNRWKFKQLYVEALQMGGGNHDTILCGLFLGISRKEHPGKEFNLFITLLSDIYEDDAENEYITDTRMALGRLGIRLIKFLQLRSLYTEAYEVLMVLHNQSIAYARNGQPFSTLIETASHMSMCDIAVLCCDVCINNRQYDGALEVLHHCSFGIDEENPDISEKEAAALNGVVVPLIEGFIANEQPEEAVDLFFQVHTNIENPRKEALVKELVILSSAKNLNHLVVKFEPFLSKNLITDKNIYTIVIEALTKMRDHTKAEILFTHGMSVGVYENTYDVLNPLLMQAPTDLNKIELTMLIEYHLKKLKVDPYYEQFCERVNTKPATSGTNCSSNSNGNECNLRILIVPHKGARVGEFDTKIKKTMDDLISVVSHNVLPSLDIASQEDQYLEVTGKSIIFWYNCHNDTLGTNSAVSIKKRKRKIDVFQPSRGRESLQMTYMPTPQYEDKDNECESIIKNFPDTDDEKHARRFISKIICAKLTIYMKQGVVRAGRDFSDTGKKLFRSFMSTLPGQVVYNKQIGLKAQNFVEEQISSLS